MGDVQHQVFSNPNLLRIPSKRAAWSDRTALLMAEMSLLAYDKFEISSNGNVMTQANLDNMLGRLLTGSADAASDRLAEAEEPQDDLGLTEGAVSLQNDLAKVGFELAGLFSDQNSDSQAYLAISISKTPQNANGEEGAESGSRSKVRPFGDEEVAVLCFRGTQSAKDWRNNAKFMQKDVEGSLVHSGFQGAFDAIRPDIQRKLDPLVAAGRTLYVTGHSLGGALALIATRDMGSDSYGACYTFGSPRVGRFGFAKDIKTPIYRVVNTNDLVPRVPPAYLPAVLILILRALNAPVFGLLRRFIQMGSSYVHCGDMRFLRRTRSSTYDDLQVVPNPSAIYRFCWYWPALLANFKSPVEDHDINIYCAKLAAYATDRNPPSRTSKSNKV